MAFAGRFFSVSQDRFGNVSMCPCGVVTITLHYMSLRFEPAAFRELLGMLNFAQRRLDGDPAIEAALQSPPSMDAPPVH